MADLWIKLAVTFSRHPKVIKVGAEAAWLAVCAMLYAREHMTDGVILTAVVPTLAAVKRPMDLAAKLVTAGLWDTHPDGFVVHDFLTWNPSRSEVESKRDKWKDTKRTQRSVHDGHTSGQVADNRVDKPLDTNETPHAYADAGARSAHSASVSESIPGVGLEGGAGETIAPSRGSMGGLGTIIDGREQRRHGEHASPAACAIGLCVHASLHRDFERRLAINGSVGPDGLALREWYIAVIDEIKASGQIPGDDVFDFWRNRFAAWVGTISTKPAKAEHRPAPQGEYNGDWFEECQRLHAGGCASQYKHGLKMANQIAAFAGEKTAAR